METSTKFVSEFPLPPPYYKLFSGHESMLPPKIPEEYDGKPYNGVIPQPNIENYHIEKDYKSLFKG